MKKVLEGLKPEGVFEIFEDFCNIPHPSGHIKEISDYCVEFAKKRNLKYIQDEFGNVIIFKEASPGLENKPAIILQGHIDMVAAKLPESKHDFKKDPLEIRIEDGFIKTNGTTLGGDDGIGAAFALAILDEDIPHPALEVLLTTDEEIGMIGATKADLSMLKGEYLINIDSEVEGEVTVGCAGGVRAECSLCIEYENLKSAFFENNTVYGKISISGLKGGHSGLEIDKQRANANNIFAVILSELIDEFDIRLVNVKGGVMDNAICEKNDSIIAFKDSDFSKIANSIKEIKDKLKVEYFAADPDLDINIELYNEKDLKVYSKETGIAVQQLINCMPQGVIAMEQADNKKVETSINLGQIWTDNDKIYLGYLLRSSNGFKKKRIKKALLSITESVKGKVKFSGEYPAWEYNPETKISKLMAKEYKKLTNKEAEVNIVHAGLECGIIISKTNVKDALSFGPDIHDIHTPNEKLDIESTKRMYEVLKRVISEI